MKLHATFSALRVQAADAAERQRVILGAVCNSPWSTDSEAKQSIVWRTALLFVYQSLRVCCFFNSVHSPLRRVNCEEAAQIFVG